MMKVDLFTVGHVSYVPVDRPKAGRPLTEGVNHIGKNGRKNLKKRKNEEPSPFCVS